MGLAITDLGLRLFAVGMVLGDGAGAVGSASTILAATPRMTEAMVRSRLRTPASRV